MKPGALPKPAPKPLESDAWRELEAILQGGIREYLVAKEAAR